MSETHKLTVDSSSNEAVKVLGKKIEKELLDLMKNKGSDAVMQRLTEIIQEEGVSSSAMQSFLNNLFNSVEWEGLTVSNGEKIIHINGIPYEVQANMEFINKNTGKSITGLALKELGVHAATQFMQSFVNGSVKSIGMIQKNDETPQLSHKSASDVVSASENQNKFVQFVQKYPGTSATIGAGSGLLNIGLFLTCLFSGDNTSIANIDKNLTKDANDINKTEQVRSGIIDQVADTNKSFRTVFDDGKPIIVLPKTAFKNAEQNISKDIESTKYVDPFASLETAMKKTQKTLKANNELINNTQDKVFVLGEGLKAKRYLDRLYKNVLAKDLSRAELTMLIDFVYNNGLKVDFTNSDKDSYKKGGVNVELKDIERYRGYLENLRNIFQGITLDQNKNLVFSSTGTLLTDQNRIEIQAALYKAVDLKLGMFGEGDFEKIKEYYLNSTKK